MFARYLLWEICGYVDVDGLSTVIHFSWFFGLFGLGLVTRPLLYLCGCGVVPRFLVEEANRDHSGGQYVC